MIRIFLVAVAILAALPMLSTQAAPELNASVHSELARTGASERYADFPPILLPESAAPALPEGRTRPGQFAELVFAFTVDTLGRVEPASVETLSAPDSAVAQAARTNLSGIRYVPARIVLDLGRCVEFNGERGHCGGLSPVVRRLRARVVLRINTSIPAPPPG